MRMKDLVAEQRAAYKFMRNCYTEMELHLKTAQAQLRNAEMDLELNAAHTRLRKIHRGVLSDLSKKHAKERAALRQKHRDTRELAKVEKAFIAKSKLEPEFWTYYPNHDGRRDTMEAVLRSLSMPVVKLDELMPAYAEWLLTAEKGTLSRWARMSAFVTARL
jgi:hypothetical protein